MELGLQGKVALVTGGSDGIGKAAARRLAQEGASVIICARRSDVLAAAVEELKKATGGEVVGIPADVTKPIELRSLFDKTIDAYGRIDILVNNAGTASALYFGDATDEDWDTDLNLKLYGAIRCSRLAISHMQKQGGGRIINVTTPGGKAPAAASVPTSVSRAAGIALTKALSKDYAKDNILVNTVCVGTIKSGQNERGWQRARTEDPSLTLDRFYADRGKSIPVGRVGEAEEVGDVIAFLASERASYVTGASINVDGGVAATV